MTPAITSAKKNNDITGRDRRLTVIVFSLFFSWLLAVPFEGQVLYGVADFHGVPAQTYVFISMAAHLAGLIVCGVFVKNMRTAKKLILFSIAVCAAVTSVLFFPPSLLWTAALILASFLVGCCVAAWGFYFKGCTPKGERIKTMADGLIFSNLLMIFLNMTAIHLSPQIGLCLSIAVLAAAFLFSLRLPKEETIKTDTAPSASGRGAVSVNKIGVFAFLCLFILTITINSGLMYQVINPAFAHLKMLTSWYWAVPYIAALFIIRNLSNKFNPSYILYIAIAMIGIAFVLFHVLGRQWTDYLLVNTLMLGACGVFDLFWWSILGDMIGYYKNPATIIGVGLAANVSGVLLGGLFGNATTGQTHTMLAFVVVCATLVLLPPLSIRLTKLLDRHVYLPVPAEITVQEQMQMINEIELTEQLTDRENEVMRLLVQGKTYKAIADELHISENTIGTHARNIYGKAGVTNRVELMALLKKPE